MCTIGLIKIAEKIYLFKNRDKLGSEDELVESNSDFVTVKTKGKDYLASGLNKHGVGFVTAEIYDLRIIDMIFKENKIKEAKELLKIEKSKRIKPSKLFANNFSQIKSAQEVINIIKSSDALFDPSVMIISDKANSFIIEFFNKDVIVREIKDRFVRTNHFFFIDYGPKKYDDYPSTFDRFDRAKNLSNNIVTLEDLKKLLRDHNPVMGENSICRHGIGKTISSIILDINNFAVEYLKGNPCENKFEKLTQVTNHA